MGYRRSIDPRDIQHRNTRSVAVDAERHWWVTRIQQRIAELEPIARTTTNIGHFAQIEIDLLNDIVRERTR